MKKLTLALLLSLASTSFAKSPILDELSQEVRQYADKAPTTAQIENGFSPDGNAEQLVLKTINSAEKSIRLAAYSFTSPKVVRALLDAKKRGVDVRAVVDGKHNNSKSGQAALNLLVNASIPTRTNSEYAIHHDKYIIVDDKHVQTGSFNYSKAAAEKNSENVIVIWNNTDLAASYLKHWQSRFNQGIDWKSTY